MLFKEYHLPMIRSGSKTVTRREWSENYNHPNVGSVVPATTALFVSVEEADCFIRILDVYEQPLGEMDDEDAQAEGDYETLEAFREGYEQVYGEGAWDPEKVVTVVEFEYVGREKPEDDAYFTHAGLACRLFDGNGHWCGYVRRPRRVEPVRWTSDYDSKHDEVIPAEVDVWGGITYGPDDNGWVGFDDAHARSLVDHREAESSEEAARAETKHLAEQIAALQEADDGD